MKIAVTCPNTATLCLLKLNQALHACQQSRPGSEAGIEADRMSSQQERDIRLVFNLLLGGGTQSAGERNPSLSHGLVPARPR